MTLVLEHQYICESFICSSLGSSAFNEVLREQKQWHRQRLRKNITKVRLQDILILARRKRLNELLAHITQKLFCKLIVLSEIILVSLRSEIFH